MDLSEQRALVPAGKDRQPTLVYSPHPLLPGADRRVETAVFLPRETIAEYLDRVGIRLRGPAVLMLNGVRLPRAMWARTRPKPGMVITLRAAVAGGGGGGGGKDPMRTVLQLAVMVAAVAITGPEGLALTGWQAAAVRGAIIIGGSLLINSLLPPPRPNLAEAQMRGQDQPSPTYALSGGSNRARPYEPLPVVLGRHRIFPDYGAKEYTEFQGDDQVLYQCFNFGFGDLVLSDFRIGNTPLTSYVDYQLELSPANGKLALFPAQVDTVEGGALTYGNPIQRTSSVGATALAIDLTGSLYGLDANGATDLSVDIRCQYRKVGDTVWSAFPPVTASSSSDASSATTVVYGQASNYWSAGYYLDWGGTSVWEQVDFGSTDPAEHYDGEVWATLGDPTYTWRWRPYSEIDLSDPYFTDSAPDPTIITAANDSGAVGLTSGTTKPLRIAYRIDVPAGQYEVKVERLSPDETETSKVSQIVFAQLKSYVPDATDYTGQVRVALKIKASGQLSGRVDQFSALASARCQAWDGVSAWAQRETSNPAWWYLAFARGSFNGTARLWGAGLADARIDIESIKAFGAWCTSKSLSFNGVLDRSMSCQEVLEAIARCGRGSMSWGPGKLSVVWDAPNQAVSAVYGMGNIIAQSMKIAYTTDKVADEVVVRFINPDLDWQQDEVRALVPGTVTSQRPVSVDLWGCTDRDMAGREANLIAADQYYHNAKLSFETDMEGFVNVRGDTILLAHDIMRTSWGYSGRLVEGTTAGVLKLSRKVPFTPAASHYVLVKKPDGTFGIYAVNYVAGESDTLTLTAPMAFNPSADPDGMSVYDYVWAFDLRATPGRRVKIVGMPSVRQDRVQIQVVDDTPDYYAAESGIYTHVGGTTTVDAPVITNLTASEMLVRGGAGYLVRVTFTWDVSGRYDHATVRASVNGEPLTYHGQISGRRFDIDVPDGSTVKIDVTAIHPLGMMGPGSVATLTHGVVGSASSRPGDVPWFDLDGDRLSWGTVADLDVQFGGGYRIKFHYGVNRSWFDASPLPGSGSIVTATPWVMPFRPPGQVTIMIVAVDASGLESAHPAYIITDLGDVIVDNLVESFDIKALGFPGTITGGSVVAGNLTADDATDRMWSNDDQAMWTYDSLLEWQAAMYKQLLYRFNITPSLAGNSAGMVLDWTVQGLSYALSYRRNAPLPMWTLDSELEWASDPLTAMWAMPDGELPLATPMWTGDPTLMWSDDQRGMWETRAGGYQTWPGKITATNEPYDFYISIAGGGTQGKISALSVVVDMPDIEESFQDQVIAALGTRLPITKTYRAIKNVKMSLEYDGHGAVGLQCVDKNPTLGPLIKGINDAGAYVQALGDFTLQGY